MAHKYLSEVVNDFDAYAKKHYLGALESARPAPSNTLAALRYIATRKLHDHQPRLREIFTTRFSGQLGREIDAGCLEALLETTNDPLRTARFLVDVACRKKPLPTSRLAVAGLERLGTHGCEALLFDLASPQPRKRCKKAADVLEQISGVSSGQPASFWMRADDAERTKAVEMWKVRLRSARKLSPPDPVEIKDQPAGEDYWNRIFDLADADDAPSPR